MYFERKTFKKNLFWSIKTNLRQYIGFTSFQGKNIIFFFLCKLRMRQIMYQSEKRAKAT